MNEPDPARMALYQYVRDQHDKLIGVRQGQKTRLGSYLVLGGLLITAVFTFGVPTTLATIKQLAALPAGGFLLWSFAFLPVVPFAGAMYYLARSLWAIVGALARVIVSHAGVDRNRIASAMERPQHVDGMIRTLTLNYLDAIQENEDENYETGCQFARILMSVRRSALFVFVFLTSTVLVAVVMSAVLPPPPVK